MSSSPVPYWRLSSFYFWYYAALGGFTPYFAQWLHDIGQPGFQISLVMATWYGTRMVAPALWSQALSRSVRPLHWLRAGALLTAIGFAGFLFARDFLALLVVMAIFSFFCNAIMPQFEALTLDTLDARRADYGRIRVWGSVGFISITLAFGAVIEVQGSALLPAAMLPLFAATAISALLNRAPSRLHHEDIAPGGLPAALRRPGVPVFLAMALLMQIGFGPFYVFFTLHLGQAGHGADTIGGLWALGVMAEIVIFLFAPRLLRRHAPRTLVLLCLGCTVLRWSVTALWPHSLPAMVLMQLLHALSFGVFHACCMHLVAGYFPGRLSVQGQALLYGLSSGAGGVLGSLMAGTAWTLGGGQAAFLAGACAAAAGYLLALRLRPAAAEITAA